MAFSGPTRGEMQDTARLLHMLERIAKALEEQNEREAERRKLYEE